MNPGNLPFQGFFVLCQKCKAWPFWMNQKHSLCQLRKGNPCLSFLACKNSLCTTSLWFPLLRLRVAEWRNSLGGHWGQQLDWGKHDACLRGKCYLNLFSRCLSWVSRLSKNDFISGDSKVFACLILSAQVPQRTKRCVCLPVLLSKISLLCFWVWHAQT